MLVRSGFILLSIAGSLFALGCNDAGDSTPARRIGGPQTPERDATPTVQPGVTPSAGGATERSADPQVTAPSPRTLEAPPDQARETPPPTSAETRTTLTLARAALAAGDLTAARVHVAAALERAPSSSAAWNTAGRVHLAAGDLEAAALAFTRAVEENAENGFAWNNLGLVRIRQARWDEAIHALEVATATPHPAPFMWNNLGAALEARGRLALARAAYQRGATAGSHLAARALERLDATSSPTTASEDPPVLE